MFLLGTPVYFLEILAGIPIIPACQPHFLHRWRLPLLPRKFASLLGKGMDKEQPPGACSQEPGTEGPH